MRRKATKTLALFPELYSRIILSEPLSLLHVTSETLWKYEKVLIFRYAPSEGIIRVTPKTLHNNRIPGWGALWYDIATVVFICFVVIIFMFAHLNGFFSFFYFLASLPFDFFLPKYHFSCAVVVKIFVTSRCYCFNLSPNAWYTKGNGIHNLWRKIYKNANRLFFFLPAIAWLASIISSLLAAIEREEIGQTPRPRCRHSVEKDISHCTPSQLKTYAITFKCNENTIAPIDYEIIMKTKFQNKYKMAMTMQWYFPSKLVFFRVRTSKRKKQNPGTSFGSISLPIFA